MARRELESVPLSRFGVLVSQLESIAASARQQPPDALLCFDLLSDLAADIEEEPKESIVLWQRKCEDALYSLLVLGARRPVRRLASAAMVRVISKGDGISIYSRASTLQGWLVDCKKNEPLSVAGVAQCLGEIYRFFGRRITSGLLETINIAAKLMKFHEDFVRQDALQMLEKALEGSAASGAPTAYSEAFRIIMRVGVCDKSFIVRLAAARCLKTFASIGGPGLGIAELESSLTFCIKALEDSVSFVRDAFAEALGALLALAMHPQAQVRQGGKNHSAPAKKLDDVLQKHLKSPFIRASGFRAKNLRIGLTLSWVSFLQVVHLQYHVPDFELPNFALQAMDMLQGNPSANAHALACLLYILRVGVSDQMTEPTQRSFLVLLAKKLESADYSPSVGVATLRILSYLLTTLGEWYAGILRLVRLSAFVELLGIRTLHDVPIEFKDILDNTVVAALSHSSLHVRVEAALTLRAIAEVDPTCVGGLISYGVTTLQALRETTSTGKGINSNLELDSLHGQATILSALVSISPKLLLGYPARLPKSVFELSRKMLTEFSRNTVVATVEKEAGWLLLASLIASMPKEELEDQVFDVLLLWANPFVGNPDFLIRQTQDLPSEMRVLSAAIEALTTFIRSFVTPISATNAGIFLQPVLAYLSGALSYISYLTTKETQNLKPALDLFIIRTLMAYQAISDPMAYKSEHAQIIQICTTPFSDPAGCEESSCLRFLLDKRDACLGPWIPGRDWFEDELRAFDGGNDGLMPCVWDDEVSSFPQPEPISKMLVNQKLLCFANIFASQDDGGKVILLNKIDQCLKSGKKQPWRVASITNSCVGLLAGLKVVLALRPQTLGLDILSSVQAIFQGILAEGDTCSAQRRASSEGLGLLARFGSDIFTARMTRSLLGELAVATDPNYIGSLAFTLGCIHRSAGGMALSTLVPATVNSLSQLAKSSNADLQLWSLHALLLTIDASGLSYVSQVQATLFLAIEILLSEESGLVALRQEIGHLINVIVAVLGPELSPGSTFFCRCKSVIAEISSCHETSTLLESVRFTQQLVLFAPQAVSVQSHVQSLLPTLTSKQPSLRHLAVSTLRHLIEKDPVAMIDEKIEESLFSMLDEETDSEIGNLVRATITRLLYTSCPSCPSRWLAIFRNLVLATSTRSNAISNVARSENEQLNGTSEADAYGEDDEDMIASSQGSVSSVHSNNPIRQKHLRYRTKVFAAECLSYLPTAVGIDPAHFDLSLARTQPGNGRTSSGDWLVLQLQELVSISYQISTGQFEGMQPIGVRLLSIVMDKFEKIPDPEVPGHLLMEQYQAQLVSAIRSAISVSAGPLLLEAGLQLATKILRSSVISGDQVALSRMFSLISRPLNDIKDLYYPSFAEWVACKIKVRLLAAHASIKCYVYQFIREQKSIPDEYLQLIPLFSTSSTILGKYWISVLKDYTCICFGLHSKFNHIPFLDGIQSPLVSSKVKECLDEAWPLILQATAFDAVPVTPETDKHSVNNIEDLPKTLLSSGYHMVSLEFWEFQFLWGLALLILFQEQQVDSGKQVQLLLTHRKKEHYWMSGEIALPVFVSLSKEVFFRHKFLTLDLCRDLLQVLIYAEHMVDPWHSLVTCLLSQIVQFCPDMFFEKEDFVATATELYFKHLFIAFQSDDATTQECPSFGDLLSEFSIVAETIASRTSHKMSQWKLILAFVSVCHQLFRGASTNQALFNIITFVQNIVPSLTKCFRAIWWSNFGDEVPELQKFAVRVLSLTCTASACERNWSTFNQVHTKRRNRLSTQKMNKLVYVMYNKRLNSRHLKMMTLEGDDLLEAEELPSDDEWLISSTASLPEDEDEDLDGEVREEHVGGSTSGSRGRRGSQGQGSGSRGRIGSQSQGQGRSREVVEQGEDEAGLSIDDYSQLKTVLGAWASMFSFLSQDCIRRIHAIDNKMSSLYKLLVKMLAFCLEEAASLARLLHEKSHLGQDKADHIFIFSIFKNSTKCIRDTLYDSNIQVQILGLHVLKNIAQRDIAEGSHVKNYSFSLFFAGELFGDIFILLQHTLKECINRVSIAVIEECLRLLFLFCTLSQESECQQAVTVLLLEALLIVFSVSSSNHSQELNEVNTSTRKLVSHLVQMPSSASQIKDAMLSMPLTRRQEFQDMIRASVTQTQMIKNKLNVESVPNAIEDKHIHGTDSIDPHADKHVIKEDADNHNIEEDNDEEDWDAFQSFAANDMPSTTDSLVYRGTSEADTVVEDSTMVTDHDHEKHSRLHNTPHLRVSLETDEQNPEACTGKELTSPEKNEIEKSSDVLHYEDDDIIENKGDDNGQLVSDLDVLDIDSNKLLEDHSAEENGEKMMGWESNPTNTIGSSTHDLENEELNKESEGDDDDFHKHLDSVLTSSKDDSESDSRRLHHEGGESKHTNDEDSFQLSTSAASEDDMEGE